MVERGVSIEYSYLVVLLRGPGALVRSGSLLSRLELMLFAL